MSKNEVTVQEDKKIIKKLFWRSFELEGSFNF